MIKKVSLYHLFTIIVLVLLLRYTYVAMLSLGFDQNTGSAVIGIVKLVIVAMTVFVMIVSANKIQTSFSVLWILWSIWLFIVFFVLGLRGESAANIFQVTFCPMIFVFFYTVSLYSDKIRSISVIGFFILYIAALYLIIVNLNQIKEVVIGEEVGITNLIYWCLCPLPFLLLVEKPWIRAMAIGMTVIIVIVTGKRSAAIAIALIVLFYVFNASREGHKIRNMIGVLAIGAILYYVIYKYFAGTFFGVLERINNMQEDQGSGRIKIYEDVFNVMKSNSFTDWFVGRGYGSITITRHTNAHNDALQMLFEFGIVGLIVYMLMIVNLVKRMLILRRTKSFYYVGYMASVVITIVLGLVSNLVVFYSYFAFLCAFWGIVEAKMIQDGLLRQIIISSK